ncbi:lipid droplet-regulating VLDL assembly factor AUP1 [Aplochiton taeniatus]
METRAIEEMFDFRRLPTDGLILLLFLIYSPVGLCLMFLRVFIGVHVFLVSCALPESLLRRCIVRIMCSMLGMHVKQSNHHSRDRHTKLFICNHVTEFDHNIINLLTPCNTPMLGGSAGFLCWARGYTELDSASGVAGMEESLERYCSMADSVPLLLFPEEETTNGRAGLLKFSSWPFSVTHSIQPVAVRVKRPFLALNTPGSSWVTELLWTFFVPCTVYHVSWLPPVSRQDGESLQEYANKVQEMLACELGLVSTQITKADKAEHVKRKRHIAPQATNTSVRSRSIFTGQNTGADNPGIRRMAEQVQEVLPDVPFSLITRDLVQTNCVDATITNLLEMSDDSTSEAIGGQAFGPFRNSTTVAAAPVPTITKTFCYPQTASKLFGKSPVDRHLSLQERKEALYEFARRRYIEKHGLDREDCP